MDKEDKKWVIKIVLLIIIILAAFAAVGMLYVKL